MRQSKWTGGLCVCLIVLSICNSTRAGGQSRTAQPAVFSHTSLDSAWESTLKSQRPLLVMFTSDNCAYCVKMLRDTYGDPGIERLLKKRTEGVLAHADVHQALVSRLGIRGFPTSMLVSPQGEVLAVVEGYLDAETFARRVAPLLSPQARRPTKPAHSGVAIRAVGQ